MYLSHFPAPSSLRWLLFLASPVAALMAFNIGANDSANAWGTSVGSGAIKLHYAVVIGGFMNWAGASILGSGVSDTITKGVAHVTVDTCWACGRCDSRMGLYVVGTCLKVATDDHPNVVAGCYRYMSGLCSLRIGTAKQVTMLVALPTLSPSSMMRMCTVSWTCVSSFMAFWQLGCTACKNKSNTLMQASSRCLVQAVI